MRPFWVTHNQKNFSSIDIQASGSINGGLGILSYVYIKLFNPLYGDSTFTSMTCPSLSSSTLLQIPRSHLLFSLDSYTKNITWQSISTSDGHPITLLTLCPSSTILFHQFRGQTQPYNIYAAVKVLQAKIKHKAMEVDGDPEREGEVASSD